MKTIGVIGLGSIGMRHAKNLREMGYNVRAWDPDMKRRLMFDGVLWNPEEIWQARNVDGIVIASPTKYHYEHLGAAWQAGKPTFVEKPIADRPIAMVMPPPPNALTVGYNLRFHSCVKKAKEWLDAGLIGDPIWASFTCAQFNDKPAYLRDGVILNWSHEIDLALYLLGPAKVATSMTLSRGGLRDGHDVMTDIILSHGPTDCRSTIHLDYLTKPELRTGRIIGTEGSIEFELVHARTAVLLERDDKLRAIEMFKGEDTYDENYVEEMKAFIDRIDGKETIGCTGEEALKVLEICLEVRKQAGL